MLLNSNDPNQQRWVPTVTYTGKPLMPCHPARARKLIAQGKAKSRYNKGLFYIVLLDRTDGDVQPIAVGIDPGSKMEAYTVKSEKRTFLNIQAYAVNAKAIKKKLETRKVARRDRRRRKTPCRACRINRAKKKDWVPPSTLARWQQKYNTVVWLKRFFPILCVIVEDIKAKTIKGQNKKTKRWNNNFSPIQCGKNWFYHKLSVLNLKLVKVEGFQTYEMRKIMGLYKTTNKMATVFGAHCVDSWTLANYWVGGHVKPDLEAMVIIKPMAICRRQLFNINTSKKGFRQRYGGSDSLGVRKGTLVLHFKYNYCFVGGTNGKDRVSLHATLSGSRLAQNAKISDLKLVAHTPWSLYDPAAVSRKEKKASRRLRALQLRNRPCVTFNIDYHLENL